VVEERSAPQPVRISEEGSPENERLEEQNSDNGQGRKSAFELNPPVVLMKGTNDPTFVISFHSQKEFVIALAWKSAGMVLGGTAITLLGLYMLLAQRGLL